MHPHITQEIGRLQIEEMVSHARSARLARRSGSGRAPAPSRTRRPQFPRARALRTSTNA